MIDDSISFPRQVELSLILGDQPGLSRVLEKSDEK